MVNELITLSIFKICTLSYFNYILGNFFLIFLVFQNFYISL